MADARRLAIVGVSISEIDGVRDHSTLLAEGLRREGFACSLHWLSRSPSALLDERSQMRAWATTVGSELERTRPDAVLLAYSVFVFAHRGVPLYVAPTLAALRRTGSPMLGVLHEFVHPWRLSGVRGKVWAPTQRLALLQVMRAASGVIVTTDFQARWLASRHWLPRRPVKLAPVFSNLPSPSSALRRDHAHRAVGVFSYSYHGVAASLVLDALSLLRAQGLALELRLLGAPGRDSSSGVAWREAAAARGLADAISFSGTLPAQALSDELAACDVLLFPDLSGPTSRKGSLAAALASGAPVIALDGHRTWGELRDAGAATMVAPRGDDLATALGATIADERAAATLGQRGRAFAERRMGLQTTVNAVLELLDEAGAQTPDGNGRTVERQVERASR